MLACIIYMLCYYMYMLLLLLLLLMMSGFVERVIDSPQTRYQSGKLVGRQMSS